MLKAILFCFMSMFTCMFVYADPPESKEQCSINIEQPEMLCIDTDNSEPVLLETDCLKHFRFEPDSRTRSRTENEPADRLKGNHNVTLKNFKRYWWFCRGSPTVKN